MLEHYGRMRQVLVLLGLLVCWSSTSAAQTITGVVTDESGAVLPGVTVEAKSPALIEPSRVVVSDDAGRYRIVNLPIGTFSVTFTLEGFRAATRPGIQLTTNFTATVNMQLGLGQLTEAVTVTSDAPLVDVQSSAAPQTITREVLDVLPTGRSAEAVGILLPGVTLRSSGGGPVSRDVGGTTMINQSPLQFRGTNDTVQVISGMRRVYLRPAPEFNGVYVNDGAVQEISFGQGAEAMDMGQSGLRINLIPRSGGNTFHGTVLGAYTRDSFMSEMNIDERLRSLNFTTPTGLVKLWDFNPTVGGPILRDRLWFSTSYRNWGVTNAAPITVNTDTTHQYRIPGTEAADDPGSIWDTTTRITWQATKADNVTAYVEEQKRTRARFTISSVTSPEASSVNSFPSSTYQVAWTRVQNSNLIFEAGYQYFKMQNQTRPQDPALRELWTFDDIRTPKTAPPPYFSIQEQTTNIRYNASTSSNNDFNSNNHYRAALTFIKGAHEMKAGGSFFNGRSFSPRQPLGYASYVYRNTSPIDPTTGQRDPTKSTPFSVTLALPNAQEDQLKADIGLYVQDRWRLNRLTVNAGLRFDMLRTGWPEEILPANPYTPETRFAARDTFVDWKDLSPRVGGAYDLFGNGRTAIKGSIARYVAAETINLNAQGNPMSAIPTSATRSWNDNGDRTVFNPDFTLQESELGPTSNANFGKVVQTTTVDPDLLVGYGKRPWTNEFDFGIQHQLASRASATVMFYHRWSGNQIALQNMAVTRADFSDEFCVTAPTNSKLPGGGGYQVCGLHDAAPGRQGAVQNLITSADNIGGGIKQSNTGLTLSANLRAADVFVQGGIDMRKDLQNTCGLFTGNHPGAVALDSTGRMIQIGAAGALAANPGYDTVTFPDGSRYCDLDTGYRPDVKFSGSYELPWWGLQTSATYQNAAGPQIIATWAAPNSAIVPGLGRNLSTGANSSKQVELVQPNTIFGDRLNQIDVRFTKRFAVGGTARLSIDADVYNVTNSNWIIGYTATVGPNLHRPTQVLTPRLFKIGGRFDF